LTVIGHERQGALSAAAARRGAATSAAGTHDSWLSLVSRSHTDFPPTGSSRNNKTIRTARAATSLPGWPDRFPLPAARFDRPDQQEGSSPS